MKIQPVLILLILLSCFNANAQDFLSKKPYSIGEAHEIKSVILGEERTLNIYLPYHFDKTKSLPVIYVLDGSANEDFLHIVGLVQFFNMQYKMPDCIVVGIANVDRKRDFTFETGSKAMKETLPTSGNSENFMQFIEKEVQPYIAKNYRTSDTKYLIGQSLGGLLATEILLKRPQLFSHYLIVSPSLWWDDESLLRDAKPFLDRNPDSPTYVYIAVGGKEDKMIQKDAKDLASLLQKSKLSKLKTDFLVLPEENHATILHQGIDEAFKKLFPYKK